MFHVISFSPHFIDHVSIYFLKSTLHWSCFIFISFSPQSISFISPTAVHLVHVCLIWLYSYYIVIQIHCQFHVSANASLEINDRRVSLDKFSILNRYSLLEADFRSFYCSLSLYIKQEIQHGVRRNVLVCSATNVYLLIYSTQAYIGKR